jgi:tetratricopeptide (TPR) repeat protein
MASENPKSPNLKRPAAAPSAPVTPATQETTPPSAPPGKLPPLFRPIDWLAFGLTFIVSLVGYLYTLAPDLTLQDSGELAVGSMYAGVPHPPGYPVWTLYTWVFTKIIPFGNMAFRVGVSSAFASALACGLLTLIVSRGSSMFMESIAEFKTIARKTENFICLISGVVAGLLIAFNAFMWSQALIVEVYALSSLSLIGGVVCLLHWTYAPNQYRYLYFSWFLCGISFNNHQSLFVITVAMEILMIAVQPKIGRAMMLWNSIFFVVGIMLTSKGSTLMSGNNMLYGIFFIIGIASLIGYVWLSIITRVTATEFMRDTILTVVTLGAMAAGGVRAMLVSTSLVLLIFLGLDIYLTSQRRPMSWAPQWRKAIACGIAFMMGAAFYLYMPLASMSNPPLNWGYPRTVGGFIHAFTRGQYEKIRPTTGHGANAVEVAVSWVTTYAKQVRFILIEGPVEEFSLGYLAIGLIPLFFFRRLQPRERAWLIGLVAFYIVLGPFLLQLFNPAPDRQSISLNKPFFIASHCFIAIAIGYGISLAVASLVANYQRFRMPALIGCGVLALASLWFGVADAYRPETPYWIPRFAAVWSFSLAVLATLVLAFWKQTAPVVALLGICFLMPVWTYASHWSDVEQRGHMFGFWFGHDMFTPPFKGKDGKLTYKRAEREELLKTPEGQKSIYPEMAKDTILFGGTDPGRFCPTYMIFCESFTKPKDKHNPEFDRRDVYIITQNALADATYLQYIRAHYNRSTEKDVPFFSELMRSDKERELNFRTNLLARMIAVPLDNFFLANGARIEKERRVGSSFFEPEHFLQLNDLAKKIEQGSGPTEVSKYLRDNLSEETRKQLGSGGIGLASSLAKDLNRILDDEWKGNLELQNLRSELATVEQQLSSGAGKASKLTARKEELNKQIAYYSKLVPFYTPGRFEGLELSKHVQKFIKEGPTNHTRIRLSRLLLESAFPKEIAVSEGGVYPDTEIRTPSNEDSQRCFQEYMNDAQMRMSKGQLRPGEDVKVVDNRVQVSGQVAVMAINALLCKVIFDQNPDNEFYIEESFPLDWMYPHLTPFGIIMKINREQLPELSQEIVDKDHQFWSDYSERLIGNWITYDTPISNITSFAERVYVNKDYRDFKGDPRFVRDEDGQKAFSKLRSSIAGVYAWRVANQTAPRAAEIEARQMRQPGVPLSAEERRALEVHNRMFREAEFSFKQAYAFCPYSPEALYRYVQLLAGARRFDDAILLAKTSRKLDPANGGLENLVRELEKMKASVGGMSSDAIAQAEQAFRLNPTDLNTAGALAQMYAQQGRTNDVLRIADTMLAIPNANAQMISFAAQVYQQLPDYVRLERALERWTKVTPTPEAWLDYAASQAVLGKRPQALASLQQALTMSAARRKTNPQAENLAASLANDARFAALKNTPEFQQLLATNK